MNIQLLTWLFGSLAAFAAGAYAYAWKVSGMIVKAKDDLQTAISKQHEAAQKASSGVMARAESLIHDLRNEVEKDRSDVDRELAAHTLEDARTYATQKYVAEVEARMFGVLTQISTKLDRVIERNNQVDRP